MKIIIVGCGKVGVSLAERLSAEGHDLVMVDMNPQKVEHLSNQFDALGIPLNFLLHKKPLPGTLVMVPGSF